MQVHHRRPLFWARSETELWSETWRPGNLEVLCRPCHRKHTDAMLERVAAKRRKQRETPSDQAWDALVEARITRPSAVSQAEITRQAAKQWHANLSAEGASYAQIP